MMRIARFLPELFHHVGSTLVVQIIGGKVALINVSHKRHARKIAQQVNPKVMACCEV